MGKMRKYVNAMNVDRPKSGQAKIKNAVKSLAKLKERAKVEGDTKWLKNAVVKAEAKLKKYGVKA